MSVLSVAIDQNQTNAFRAACEKTYLYYAYGLRIRSFIPLPEFPVIEPDIDLQDVSVIESDDRQWIETVRSERSIWEFRNTEARYWCRDVGGFCMRQGREIIVTPEPGVDNGLLRLYIEGMMMACILSQRGLFVLHASVIQIGQDAVAFLGHVGAGKSSMAAALHALGYAVVADDNAAIDTSRLMVFPAFPSVKVYPAIAAALGYSHDSLQPMHASQIKRAASVRNAFPSGPIVLSHIYVLDKEGPREMARLSPGQLTIELIRNSVPTRWGQCGDAFHLAACGEFSRRVSAWRVRSFETLKELPEIARRIELHALTS